MKNKKNIIEFQIISEKENELKKEVLYEFAFSNIDLKILTNDIFRLIEIIGNSTEEDISEKTKDVDFSNEAEEVISLLEKIRKHYKEDKNSYAEIVELTRDEIFMLVALLETGILKTSFSNDEKNIEIWDIEDIPYVISLRGKLTGFLKGLDVIKKIDSATQK